MEGKGFVVTDSLIWGPVGRVHRRIIVVPFVVYTLLSYIVAMTQ
jgi:hypothetical protein